jgi:DNA-cytosine methyltransferase
MVIRIGTDCSGWESVLMALKAAGVNYTHLFASDKDPSVREVLRYNFGDQFTLYDDAQDRRIQSMPKVDVYHAGFPCQPFSMAGKHGGLDDPRGTVVQHLMKYVRIHRPKVVVFENVDGLEKKHADVLKWIMRTLRSMSYTADYKILNTREHAGIPHNRERIFIVAIQSNICSKIDWPEPIKMKPLSLFMDKVKETDNQKRLPPISQSVARRNVIAMRKIIRARGHSVENYIADIDSSKVHGKEGIVPCLTKSRAQSGGHWVMARGRRLTETEMERLMGLHMKTPNGGKRVSVKKPPGFSKRKWGGIIGNAIPVPLIGRVVLKALKMSGLCKKAKDVWATPGRATN